MQFKLIIAFFNPNITDSDVDAMKKAGAKSAKKVNETGKLIHD